jgi:predicted nucleotidyltransferase
MTVVTVAERKRRSAEKLNAAAEAVIAELLAYARAKSGGGRFIVFGSAASATMRHGSDFDVIVDFPPGDETAAWQEVEVSCARHGIKPDVLPASMTKRSFIDSVEKSPIRIILE